MIDPVLRRRLHRIARRLVLQRCLFVIAVAWMVTVAVSATLTASGIAHGFWLPLVSATVAVTAVIAAAMRPVANESVARFLERRFPDLGERLLTALEVRSEDGRGFGFLQFELLEAVVRHDDQHDWRRAIPAGRWWALSLLNVAGLAAAFAACTRSPVLADVPVLGADAPESVTGDESPVLDVDVQPGDTEVERGMPLVVTARFGVAPDAAELLMRTADGETRTRPMSQSLGDPLFVSRVSGVGENLEYAVATESGRSPWYHVSVFDRPRLERADLVVHWPEYSGRGIETIADARVATIVEGAAVEFRCLVNKPLARVQLVGDSGSVAFDLDAKEREPVYVARIQPATTSVFRLELEDADGHRNAEPPEFEIVVVPNRRPELEIAFPGSDLRVSPLEELVVAGTAFDDFGLVDWGLRYRLDDGPWHDVSFGPGDAGTRNAAETLVAFETLDARPDQLLSYHLYARDHDAAGGLRTTRGDLFFAEVRHFEEIFRQGRQPPGGSGQQQKSGKQSANAAKAGELAKQQKQVLTATWNLLQRIEADDRSWQNDAGVIRDAQFALTGQLAELASRLNDPKSLATVATISASMEQAFNSLSTATDELDVAVLESALAPERTAYRKLLELRAREHQVTKGQRGGSSSSGSSAGRSQRQLQQLELTQKEQRYQTNQRSRQTASGSANRDTERLQVLNRLRELAQRQSEINQRLRDLEAERRSANKEREREIERELKRLRDRQREVLRDVDQLRNRVDRADEARDEDGTKQQLERTREQVRRASDALERGQTSQAVSAGTRAERRLGELRDEFRRRTAGQFGERMRDLAEKANEVDARQQELSRQLSDESKNDGKPSLRATRDGDAIANELRRQREQLDEIVEEAKRVVEDAEHVEPLLSRRLYDTIREQRKHATGEQLDRAARSAAGNRFEDAQAAERAAAAGLDALKKGIDAAGEAVTGGEVESLRRARTAVSDLKRKLNEEIARNNPRPSQPGSGEKSAEMKRGSAPASASSPMPNANGAGPRAGQPKASEGSKGRGTGSPMPSGAPSSESSPMPGGQSSSAGGGRQTPKRSSRLQSLSGTPGGGSASRGPGGPLTGADFRSWSDELRTVEELLGESRLREGAAKVRDRAHRVRAEFRRHSKTPNWGLVRETILDPLVELESRIDEEIARRKAESSLVPLDRDPVPEAYRELVRRYYERLGDGE